MDASNVAMRSRRAVVHVATFTLLVAGAFSLLGTAAIAQNSSEGQSLSTVTVKATRVEQHDVGTTYDGIAVEQLSQTRLVNVADLNLDTPQGKAALHERIRNNAREMCQQLAARYPLQETWVDDVQTCVHNAMLTWMPHIHGIPHVDAVASTEQQNQGAPR